MSFKNGKAKDGSSLEPTKIPTAIDVAFAAGFFEGEGCFYASSPRTRKHSLVALVGQKDPELLFRMREWFGGSISTRKNSGANKIILYAWMISGDRARTFADAIWPFLTIRRKNQLVKAYPEFLSVSVTTARPASSNGMMIQSELHGNMQSSAEMSEPVKK